MGGGARWWDSLAVAHPATVSPSPKCCHQGTSQVLSVHHGLNLLSGDASAARPECQTAHPMTKHFPATTGSTVLDTVWENLPTFASSFLASVKPKPQMSQICFPQAKNNSSQDTDSSLNSGVKVQVQRAFSSVSALSLCSNPLTLPAGLGRWCGGPGQKSGWKEILSASPVWNLLRVKALGAAWMVVRLVEQGRKTEA